MSDGGALPENVLHGKTGWVVPKRNPQKLAQQIEEVLHKTTEEIELIRQNARKRIEDQFTLEKQNQAFTNFYC